MTEPERVVILGASGFLGRALHARLSGDGASLLGLIARSSRYLIRLIGSRLGLVDSGGRAAIEKEMANLGKKAVLPPLVPFNSTEWPWKIDPFAGKE